MARARLLSSTVSKSGYAYTCFTGPDGSYVGSANRRNGACVQIGEVVSTVPTIGFNLESVTYKNLNFNVWV